MLLFGLSCPKVCGKMAGLEISVSLVLQGLQCSAIVLSLLVLNRSFYSAFPTHIISHMHKLGLQNLVPLQILKARHDRPSSSGKITMLYNK